MLRRAALVASAAIVLGPRPSSANLPAPAPAPRGAPANQTIEFENAGVLYDIPKAYLDRPYWRPQPNLYVTFPGFQPGNTKGEACENWFVAGMHHKCATFTFTVSGGGSGLSHRRMAENVAKGLPANLRVSSTDEFGFHLWWSRNNPSGVNFTREDRGHFLFFSCGMGVAADGQRDGVCTDAVFLSDGNSAVVLFPWRLRNELPQIEAGIDRLMTGFRR